MIDSKEYWKQRAYAAEQALKEAHENKLPPKSEMKPKMRLWVDIKDKYFPEKYSGMYYCESCEKPVNLAFAPTR